MNEPKSNRYHRLKRRAGLASLALTVALLLGLLWLRPEISRFWYVVVLAAAYELVTLPARFYGGFVLGRRYELSSQSMTAWFQGAFREFLILYGLLSIGATVVYMLIWWRPDGWWVPAAVLASVCAALITRFAPTLFLPLFYSLKPLDRPSLDARLQALSARAGVPVFGVYEWAIGDTRRANAGLTGFGARRRIILSDTLLAEHSDDEIEAILAHEMAHHVHHDLPKGLGVEILLLCAACFAASVALDLAWRPLGLPRPWDPRGMPVLLLAGGAVFLAAQPLLNALSRAAERRADRYALALTKRPEAFVSAMRRLGSQNMVEESPSPLAVWLFHTHPPVEERIAAARELTRAG